MLLLLLLLQWRRILKEFEHRRTNSLISPSREEEPIHIVINLFFDTLECSSCVRFYRGSGSMIIYLRGYTHYNCAYKKKYICTYSNCYRYTKLPHLNNPTYICFCLTNNTTYRNARGFWLRFSKDEKRVFCELLFFSLTLIPAPCTIMLDVMSNEK